MPPPVLPAVPRKETLPPLSPPRGFSPEASRASSSGTRKNAGFKPIGQASSAVKRFFPGDEDDDEERVKTLVPVIPPDDAEPKRLFINPVQDEAARTTELPLPSRHRVGGRSPYSEKPHTRDYNGYLPPSPPPMSPRIHDQPHSAVHDGYKPHPFDQLFRRPMDSYAPLATPSTTRPSSPRGSSKDEVYEIVSQVGEGTFGKVYKARNTFTGQFVALKRIRMETERDGFPVTAMREIKLLQALRHDNVVRLYEMMVAGSKSCLSLV